MAPTLHGTHVPGEEAVPQLNSGHRPYLFDNFVGEVSIVGGTEIPSALAVLRLIASSNFVGV
jgi:hypothetical protein